MERRTVTKPSNMIKSIGYDAAKKILEVELVPHKEGGVAKVYQYSPFPQEKYNEFIHADSLGNYFLKQIKPNYTCARVAVEPEKGPTPTAA